MGDQDRPALIQLVNTSFGAQAATESVTLTSLEINPSCAVSTVGAGSSPCPAPEPRPDPALPILDLDAVSGGGTTCPGGPFVITGPDAEGDYAITPTTGPLTLAPVGQPGSSCIIAFTFDVIQRPNDGSTFQVARVTATSPTFPSPTVHAGASTVTVNQAPPSIATLVSVPAAPGETPTVPPGTVFTDTATVTGVANGPTPTGTVGFVVYQDAPGGAPCSGTATNLGIAPLTGPPPSPPTPPAATATSAPVTATTPGTYRFLATYSGDVNYAASGPTPCGAPGENVAVALLQATIVTQASTNATNVPPGTTVTDQATVTPPPGGPAPTGTVTYTLVGPNPDPSCTAPIVGSSTVPVGHPSAPFVVSAPGPYNFVATYSGDANYSPVTTPVGCGDPNEMFTVALQQVGVATQATASATVGLAISDVATVTGAPGGPVPTGTVTFTLFGPDDATCAGAPVFVSPNRPLAGGPLPTANSDPFTPTQPGTYRWIAAYSGDANYAPVTTPCNEPNETSVVSPLPTIMVEKTASPANRPEPGGEFTYTVVVTNTSTEPLTITSLTDSVYGDLATRPGSTCGTAVGATLQPGDSSTCTFVGPFTGDPGQGLTDVVTVTAVNPHGVTATDTDDATVSITDVAPTIVVEHEASPASLPEPGGTFAFSVTVTNTGTEPVTITSLTDTVHGDLATRPGSTCGPVVGQTLPPGGSATCTFGGPFTANAGASQTHTVTATAVDDDGTSASDTDDAVVTLTAVAPAVLVTTDVSPADRAEPGGDFTYTIRVTNTGTVEALTITALVDSVHGNLATRPGSTCGTLIGTVLVPGAISAPCTFTAPFTGNGGASQTAVVTVTGVDDDGQAATATDDATVSITGVAPRVILEVSSSPPALPAPGGSITFTVTVRNVSNPETITIVSLVSDVHGDLNGRGSCRAGVVVPPPPDPASVYTCSFTSTLTRAPDGSLAARSFRAAAGPLTAASSHAEADSLTALFTVVVRDDDNQTVTATHQQVVRLAAVDATRQPRPTETRQELPVTGTSAGGLAKNAVGLLVAGFVLVALADRRLRSLAVVGWRRWEAGPSHAGGVGARPAWWRRTGRRTRNDRPAPGARTSDDPDVT